MSANLPKIKREILLLNTESCQTNEQLERALGEFLAKKNEAVVDSEVTVYNQISKLEQDIRQRLTISYETFFSTDELGFTTDEDSSNEDEASRKSSFDSQYNSDDESLAIRLTNVISDLGGVEEFSEKAKWCRRVVDEICMPLVVTVGEHGFEEAISLKRKFPISADCEFVWIGTKFSEDSVRGVDEGELPQTMIFHPRSFMCNQDVKSYLEACNVKLYEHQELAGLVVASDLSESAWNALEMASSTLRYGPSAAVASYALLSQFTSIECAAAMSFAIGGGVEATNRFWSKPESSKEVEEDGCELNTDRDPSELTIGKG